MPHKILIVDDEQDIRTAVRGILEDESYSVLDAASADEALNLLVTDTFDLIILDVWLKTGERDGLDLLTKIRKKHARLPILMMSGHGTIEMAVTAMRQGAYDFIEKPFQIDRMLMTIERAIENANLREQNQHLREQVAGVAGVSDLIGTSQSITIIRHAIEKVAPTGSRVLLTGPSGTGKEVAARMIHRLSPRANGPFVVITCGGVETERLEHDLFGNAHHPGMLYQGNGGTVFLDEIGDLPPATQAKILRALQDQKYQHPVTGAWIDVDVRVVSSTNKDLMVLIKTGDFREDLYYRLNVVTIDMVPVSARRDDVPLFIDHFMRACADVTRKPMRTLTPTAMAALQLYDWPGNIRQLKNVAEWLVIMAAGTPDTPIDVDGLPPEINHMPGTMPSGLHLPPELLALSLRDAREVFERTYLQAQIARFGGSVSKAAQFVGMERSALHRKLKMLTEGGEDDQVAQDNSRDVA